MSVRRVITATAVVLIAVLCVPAALPAGLNAADLIVLFAPITLVAVVARPRRPKTPAGGDSPTDAPHVTPPAGPLP